MRNGSIVRYAVIPEEQKLHHIIAREREGRILTCPRGNVGLMNSG